MSESAIFCYEIIFLYTKHVPLPKQLLIGLIKELIGQQLGREKLDRRAKLGEHWEEEGHILGVAERIKMGRPY